MNIKITTNYLTEGLEVWNEGKPETPARIWTMDIV
jgi:hypothetical protein